MAVDIDAILRAIESKPRPSPVGNLNPQQNNIAQMLALNSSFKSKATKDVPIDRDTSGPSVISRIFDILSRPNYAVAEYADRVIQNHERPEFTGSDSILDIAGKYAGSTFDSLTTGKNLEGLWGGFSGKDKTFFSDVIQNVNPNTELNPVGKFGGGLALDILLDPTTYIGPGLIKGAYQGIKKATGLGGKNVVARNAPKEAGKITHMQFPDIKPLPDKPGHFNLQTEKALNPSEVLELRGVGLDVSPAISKASVSIKPGLLENLPKGLAQGGRINRPKLIESIIAETLEKSPRRKPAAVRKETEQLVASLLPMVKNPRFRKIQEEVSALQKIEKPGLATFKIAPKVATTPPVGSRADEIMGQLGPIGNSEKANAENIAQLYIDNTLSKPNKFPKGTAAPAVNNPAQQANLFNTLKNLERKTKGKLDSFKMLRAAEEYLIARGFAPKFWDGSEARLTDIVTELAVNADDIPNIMRAYGTSIINGFKNKNIDDIKDINVKQALSNILANNIEKEAPFVDLALEQVIHNSKRAESVLSNPKLFEFKKKLLDENKFTLEALDLSKGNIQATQRLAQELLGTTGKGTTGAKITELQRYIDNDGKPFWVNIQEAQTKLVDEATGISSKEAGKIIGPGNRAAEAFMSRMATWWGQKDIRPMVLGHSLTASNSASARARIYNNLQKKFTPEQLVLGFKVAQGRSLDVPTGELDEITDFFSKAIENLFGSTGLSKEAIAASTVAGRSGILIDDINKALVIAQSDFRFSRSRVMDDMGVVHDFSKDADWMNSWKMYDVKDPVEFMFRLETATEQLMHKYAFMDEVAARWGTKHPVGEFNTKLKLVEDTPKKNQMPEGYRRVNQNNKVLNAGSKERPHRLDGVYFPKDIAHQIERGMKTWDQIYNPNSDLIRFLDKVTRAWKAGVTIYAPSHHIRNFIGDVYLSWIAGVNNPSSYNKAAKVIMSQRKQYSDLENVENLVGRNAMANAMTKPGDKIIRTRSGHDLTADQIYVAAHNNGLLIYTHAIEDIFGGDLFGKFKPFGGKVQGVARKASENREHYVRLAHFIDVLKKSREKDLSKAFFDAAKEVRKWHPDGADLTDFERRYLRRIFPFYSWTRKAIPLMIESALIQPGKTVAYPKAMYALQGMSGIESPSMTDPFPMDQLFPDWIKEKGIGPIAAHGMEGIPGLIAGLSRSTKGFTGEDSGYTVVNPSTPFIDVVSQFGGMGKPIDPVKGLAEMSTPFFRIPAEVSQGRSFSGAPIEANKYLTDNVPIAAIIGRIFNTGFFGPTEKAEKEGQFNTEALVNLLTALGIRGTGPYEKQAEFEERDRRKEIRKARKEELK